MSRSGAFDASTPADAQTKPCRVSRDDERAARAHDADGFAQDHLDVPRVAVRAGELERTRRRVDVLQASDAAFRLRDDLLREHDDVAVLERAALRHELGEVRAGGDLGQALERQDREAHGSPVTRRPAWIL